MRLLGGQGSFPVSYEGLGLQALGQLLRAWSGWHCCAWAMVLLALWLALVSTLRALYRTSFVSQPMQRDCQQPCLSGCACAI